jgi:lipopolysaccharide biosynthesis glycosyltransferase
MTLLLAGDTAFLPGIELTLASLAIHTPSEQALHVHLVDAGLDPQAVDAVRHRLSSFDPRFSFQILTIPPSTWRSFSPPPPPGFSHQPDRLLKPYLWLAALDLVNHADRVLCLDGDLLFTRDASPLLHIDLASHAAAACQDAGHLLAHDCPDPQLAASHGHLPYHNSGVVLIDLARWRAESTFESALDFIHRHGSSIRQEDQTTFNAILAGRILTLDPTWNTPHDYLGHLEDEPATRVPVPGHVFHLWRQYKPWLGFNYMRSGALWYGLHQHYHGLSNPPYHTTLPDYSKLATRMAHPRLTSLYYRLRRHHALATFWRQRAQSGTARPHWPQRFSTAIEQSRRRWATPQKKEDTHDRPHTD